MSSFLDRIAKLFLRRPCSQKDCARETKSMREHLTESQIDKTISDSFPASDPPAWY